jgi:hypothetical protein
MSGFEDFSRDARELDHADQVEALVRSSQPAERAKGKLFALTNLMLRLMTQSANTGVHTHGGSAWKAFGKALFDLTDTGSSEAR